MTSIKVAFNKKFILNLFLKFILYVSLSLWTLLEIYPMFFMLFNGLKTKAQILTSRWSVPWPPQFSNWLTVLVGDSTHSYGLDRYFLNSSIVLIGTLILTVLISSMAGHALAYYKFTGIKFFQRIVVASVIIPVQVALIPIFVLMGNLHLRNNFLGVILLYTAFSLPFSILIMRSSFEGIPREIIEAAKLDGCSEFEIFWWITFPMVKPGISAVSAINSVGIWGELLFAFVLMNQPAMRLLNPGVMAFSGSANLNIQYLLAALTIASLPLLILFIIFQRQIMKGMSMGSFR